MRRIWNTFLAGLAAILPVTITLYLIYWLGAKAESLLGSLLRVALPANRYWPGMGLVAGFIVVLIVGTLVNAYMVRWLIRLGESWLGRIPLIKTIYGAAKDFTRFLPAGGERRDNRRVVMWKLGSARLLGFVTAEAASPRLPAAHVGDVVPVYFPMSYQIGGLTVYLPKSELIETELSVEEAMRLVLIGGVAAEAPVLERRPGSMFS